MACINQWERPKFSHFSRNPFKVDKLKEKEEEEEEEGEGGSELQAPEVKFLLHFSSSLYFFYCQSCVYYRWIVMHNFTQIKNRDFKSRFQLKNEMCVKLWVRTYVQQVLPITTGSLIPIINYYYYFL